MLICKEEKPPEDVVFFLAPTCDGFDLCFQKEGKTHVVFKYDTRSKRFSRNTMAGFEDLFDLSPYKYVQWLREDW